MRGEPFLDDDLTLIRQALDTTHPNLQGVTFETLLERGYTRLAMPRPFLPFADGGFPTPSGKCEFYSERCIAMGLDPLPTWTAPYESAERAPELVAKYPLTLISSPRHQFLNSTFVNIESLRRDAEPELMIHSADAAAREIQSGMPVVIGNDRGRFIAIARVTDEVRQGVVWAPSIWWNKLAPDGANANQTTSQRETDMGHGPVFYDNQVEVRVAD
jgi:anaerobic selenocysteine-containing dehydrogenase